MLATANSKDVYIGGFGPIQSGSIRGGSKFLGIKIPMATEPTVPDSGPAAGSRQATPSDPAALRQSSSTDLESFMP